MEEHPNLPDPWRAHVDRQLRMFITRRRIMLFVMATVIATLALHSCEIHELNKRLDRCTIRP